MKVYPCGFWTVFSRSSSCAGLSFSLSSLNCRWLHIRNHETREIRFCILLQIEQVYLVTYILTWHARPYHTTLDFTRLYYTIRYYTNFSILYFFLLYFTILYFTFLYYTVQAGRQIDKQTDMQTYGHTGEDWMRVVVEENWVIMTRSNSSAKKSNSSNTNNNRNNKHTAVPIAPLD